MQCALTSLLYGLQATDAHLQNDSLLGNRVQSQEIMIICVRYIQPKLQSICEQTHRKLDAKANFCVFTFSMNNISLPP